MELMERVREIGADSARIGDVELNAARQALLREIAREERVSAPTSRRWIGGSALIGGLAAAALVVGVVVAPPRVDGAAAAVLEQAALAVSATDAPLLPGQYLRIETVDETLLTWDVDMPEEWARFNNGNRNEAEAGFTVRSARALYVPEDRSGDWVWDWAAQPEQIVATYGAAEQALADWRAQSADSGHWPDLQLLPGGESAGAADDPHTYLLDMYRPFYGEMPRDAGALLAWFRDRSGDPDVTDQWVVGAMTDTLAANLMPADLRASLFRALALVPGITVESVHGDITTLTFASGDLLFTRHTTLDIDTARGLLVAIAERGTGPGWGSIVPDDVADHRTVVTVSIVDEAPEGARLPG